MSLAIDRCCTRVVTDQDSELLFVWQNSSRVRAARHHDNEISRDDHDRWFRGLSGSRNAIYLIVECEKRPFGVVNYREIDRENSNAQWGFFLGSDSEPSGAGTVLCFCGLDYGFKVLGFRKVSSEVISTNEKSLRLHTKFGFSQEGRLSAHVRKAGSYRDVLVFALFAHDWITRHRGPILRKISQSSELENGVY